MIEDESRSPRVPRTPPPKDPSLAAALIAETPKVKTLRSRIAELKMEQTAAIAPTKRTRQELANSSASQQKIAREGCGFDRRGHGGRAANEAGEDGQRCCTRLKA